MATLRIVADPRSELVGRSFELAGEECSIGREAGNQIVLAEAGVSRHHARLVRVAAGWEAVDLGSSNGLRVNGERVSRRRLDPGDELRIGKTTFVFDGPATTVLAPEPAFESLAVEAPRAAAMPAPPTPAAPPATPSLAAPPAPARVSGCAVGCFVLSVVLFVASTGGSLVLLYRTGHLQLPWQVSAAPAGPTRQDEP